MSVIFFLMSISLMTHVNFKKRPCHSVKFMAPTAALGAGAPYRGASRLIPPGGPGGGEAGGLVLRGGCQEVADLPPSPRRSDFTLW